MFCNRLLRRVSLGAGAAAVVAASFAPSAGAIAPADSVVAGTGSSGAAPKMSVSCTLTALKFNYGIYLANKPGGTTVDSINGENLQNIALDEWYRKGCDVNGLMPIW